MLPVFLLKYALVSAVINIVMWPVRFVAWLCSVVGFFVVLAVGLLWFDVIKFSDIPFSSNVASYVRSNSPSAYDRGITSVSEAMDAAVDKVEDVIDAIPDNATALFYRGVAYYKAGSYEDAIADLTKVLQLDSHHKKAMMYLGHCLLAIDDVDGALSYYELALNRLTDASVAAEVYLYQGRALQRQGRIEEAIHSYEQALVVKPGYKEAIEAKAAVGG